MERMVEYATVLRDLRPITLEVADNSAELRSLAEFIIVLKDPPKT